MFVVNMVNYNLVYSLLHMSYNFLRVQASSLHLYFMLILK